MANLRIVYNNIVNASTLSVSSTASSSTVGANLKSERKSSVWRSGTRSSSVGKVYMVVSSTSSMTVDCAILTFTNLTAGATMRLTGYTGTTPTLSGTVDSPTLTTTGAVTQFDTSHVLARPWASLGTWYWGSTPLGGNVYTGASNYARVWVPNSQKLPCTSYVIEINDDNPINYMEASNLIMGLSWSPKYNTGYSGLSTSINDMSTNDRTESGDLITTYGPKYKSMAFDLRWMVEADRSEINKLFRQVGKHTPIFVSLFPENAGDYEQEQLYQIYGKLKDLDAIEHPVLSMFSSKLQIEEI